MRPRAQDPQRGHKTRPQKNKSPVPQAVKQNIDPDTKVRKKGNVYYIFQKERKRISWRLVFMLFLVFLGAIGSAFSYAQIHSLQREIAQTRHAINTKLAINNELESQISITERFTREDIERLAYERLGMGEPDPSQIIYFYMPRSSAVSMNTYVPQPPQENYFWQGVVAFFSATRERIFS